MADTLPTEHRLAAAVADAITLQFIGIAQVLLPSLFVMRVPPLAEQSFPSTAMLILGLFDLLAPMVSAAAAPWAINAKTASIIRVADKMGKSFMTSPIKMNCHYSTKRGKERPVDWPDFGSAV
jgi:uncharacterized membrane protein